MTQLSDSSWPIKIYICHNLTIYKLDKDRCNISKIVSSHFALYFNLSFNLQDNLMQHSETMGIIFPTPGNILLYWHYPERRIPTACDCMSHKDTNLGSMCSDGGRRRFCSLPYFYNRLFFSQTVAAARC